MKVSVGTTYISVTGDSTHGEATRMTKKDAVSRAARYLSKIGYDVSTTPVKGIDLVAKDKANGILALVAVQTLRGKSFPLQPFSHTKARLSRFHRLTEGATAYLTRYHYKGLLRFDSVMVRDDGALDHSYRRTFRIGA